MNGLKVLRDWKAEIWKKSKMKKFQQSKKFWFFSTTTHCSFLPPLNRFSIWFKKGIKCTTGNFLTVAIIVALSEFLITDSIFSSSPLKIPCVSNTAKLWPSAAEVATRCISSLFLASDLVASIDLVGSLESFLDGLDFLGRSTPPFLRFCHFPRWGFCFLGVFLWKNGVYEVNKNVEYLMFNTIFWFFCFWHSHIVLIRLKNW